MLPLSMPSLYSLQRVEKYILVEFSAVVFKSASSCTGIVPFRPRLGIDISISCMKRFWERLIYIPSNLLPPALFRLSGRSFDVFCLDGEGVDLHKGS